MRTGNSELKAALLAFRPSIQGNWAFCEVDECCLERLRAKPLMVFREAAGITVVLPLEDAAGLKIKFAAAQIVGQSDTALHLVGFTAAISEALSRKQISANMVAAIHRDHIFVPLDRAEEALECLKQLSSSG